MLHNYAIINENQDVINKIVFDDSEYIPSHYILISDGLAVDFGDKYYNGNLIHKPFENSYWNGDIWVTPHTMALVDPTKSIFKIVDNESCLIYLIGPPNGTVTVNFNSEPETFQLDSNGYTVISLDSDTIGLIEITWSDFRLEVYFS